MNRKRDVPIGSPLTKGWILKLGVWSWSFVGIIVALIIIAFALAAVSEIVLPLTFAAVLAIIFKPLSDTLIKYGFKPNLAASIVITGLIVVTVGAIYLTVQGITDQFDEIGALVDSAIKNAAQTGTIDEASLNAIKDSAKKSAPILTEGFVAQFVSGVGLLVAIASSLIFGILIMYYFLKDGADIRRAIVKEFDKSRQKEINDFIGDACQVLRSYGSGRTAMSAVLSIAIGTASILLGLPLILTIFIANFIGGYIPYIGGFIAGALVVLVAFGQGASTGFIMLFIVIAVNAFLLNFVEPKIMGRALELHPLLILLVTTFGGLVGGLVGLILAVPLYMIAANAINRLRKRDFFDEMAVKQVLD